MTTTFRLVKRNALINPMILLNSMVQSEDYSRVILTLLLFVYASLIEKRIYVIEWDEHPKLLSQYCDN